MTANSQQKTAGMKYIFGPVNSRRLGHSLGIDPFDAKTCNYNCIYCEIGPAPVVYCERKEYTPIDEIIREISFFSENDFQGKEIDVCTISGSGEPTLHIGLGSLIRYLKKTVNRPVVVLTNGSLLYRPDVRDDLSAADIVIPSLDSARTDSFRKINRPTPGLDLQERVEGLVDFQRSFCGELWLEILLVKGINDSKGDIAALRKAVERIEPDRIQLSSVARPPSERYALPIEFEDLGDIGKRLPGRVEIIGGVKKKKARGCDEADRKEVLRLLRRRPCTAEDICCALQFTSPSVEKELANLEMEGLLLTSRHGGEVYFSSPGGEDSFSNPDRLHDLQDKTHN